MVKPPEYLTTREVAERGGVQDQTIRKRAARYGIKGWKPTPRSSFLFTREQAEQLLQMTVAPGRPVGIPVSAATRAKLSAATKQAHAAGRHKAQ